MFHIVTTYYECDNKERQKEIDKCLLLNSENADIKTIHLLNDRVYSLQFMTHRHKIVQIVVDEKNKSRLGFDYAIRYVNESLPNEKFIITNSDIYFDQTLHQLVDYDFTSTVMALSRYDNGVLFNRNDSQDSWLGLSPLRVDLELCNFKFGTLGCDNRIAWIIKHAGYDVINPCKTVHSHHLHSSNVRTYSGADTVKGEYFYPDPCELRASFARTILGSVAGAVKGEYFSRTSEAVIVTPSPNSDAAAGWVVFIVAMGSVVVVAGIALGIYFGIVKKKGKRNSMATAKLK